MTAPDFPLASIPAALDLAGIAVFALTGALLAAQLRQTFVTVAFFALVTGVGGGSVRDLLIGAPVFWIHDPWVAPVCLGTALLAWFTPTHWWEGELLDWADAAGLAAYSVIGTAKSLAFGVPMVPAVLMGIITGCVGGVIRDVLAGRPSILMRPELYVTAAALSATLAAAISSLDRHFAWSVAMAAGFTLRGAAIRKKLALPAYGSRQRHRGTD
ncbi:trimeric intracellular cation channel family protein [Novosphingobium sp. TH158]|uniref:trimeric intracellular cation channel family protein n=1 Tax=Novosphingobium sp. TH158 TaxID=2067455 RepID=UPI000C7ADDD1|nr:trimeric intracellular cation channel family protein [Novosphingobium sp. TH158]PLK24372.1 hypothetical protein C0V78_14030 [Novosphingobium sp. TH158]